MIGSSGNGELFTRVHNRRRAVSLSAQAAGVLAARRFYCVAPDFSSGVEKISVRAFFAQASVYACRVLYLRRLFMCVVTEIIRQ